MWSSSFIVLVFLRLVQGLPESFTSLIPAPLSVDRPVGEIVEGFYLEYPLVLDTRDLPESLIHKNVCLSLLMATYGDRKNIGTFRVILKSDNEAYTWVERANSVRDNEYHRFCSQGLRLRDLVGSTWMLIIEGIDSKPGRGVTVWATASSDANFTAGSRNNFSPIFNLDIKNLTPVSWRDIWVLVAICGLSTMLLFLSFSHNLRQVPAD